MIAYTVVAHFADAAVAEEWITWLRDGHVAEVLAGGAVSAHVITMDAAAGSKEVRCEVRYHFADRESFAAYERNHAPRLRAEGLSRFPSERGVRYERTLGEVRVAEWDQRHTTI